MGPGVSLHEVLEREILEIADHEKQRLGRELHDGLCQSLAGIAALAATLSRSLAASSGPGPAAAAEEIVQLLNEMIGQARDMPQGHPTHSIGGDQQGTAMIGPLAS